MDYYSLNRVILVGWVSAAPICKTTKESPNGGGGKHFAKFQLCTKAAFNKPGPPKATFHNCQAWGVRADFVGKYLRVGSYISIDGSLQCFFMDIDGKKTRFDFVSVEKIGFLPTGPGRAAGSEIATDDEPEGEGGSVPEGQQDPMDKGNPFL